MKNIQKIALFALFSIFSLPLFADLKQNVDKGFYNVESKVKIVSTTVADDFVNMAAQQLSEDQKDVKLTLTKATYADAMKLLAEGKADIVVTLDPVKQTPALCVLKPFVAVVNKANPLRDISLIRLKKIYAGLFTQWSQLGGKPSGIRLIDYKGDSDESILLKSILGNPSKKLTLTTEAESGRGIGAMVAMYPEAIGCFPLEYLTRDVQVVKIGGEYPGPKAISSGRYELVAEIKLLTRNNPSKDTKKFIEFLKSKKAKEIYHYLSLYIKDK